jgi:hypothetical protein
MEATKAKPILEQPKVKGNAGATIRLSQKHAAIVDAARTEINKDKAFKKKISICRYVEKLIEDHWQKPIEDLKKEREGAKDWLNLEYEKESPNMPFFDWVKLRIEKAEKKQSKKRNTEGEK